ncbi:MAG: MATE family efflux transporter [Clostridia bacterium]|nr:MATE family efflux transporter [Clostridia bacterium]
MARRRSYEMDLTSGNLWSQIIAYSLPLMLTSFLQLMYNAADNIVVGRFAEDGEAALAAVSSTGSLINLIVNLFIGLSVGTSIVVARYRGAGRQWDVSQTVHTSMTVSILFGIILLIVGVAFAEPLLKLMDSPDNVRGLAALYVRIYFAGMPFNMAYNFAAAVLRAVGDTRRPMYILVFSGLINVLFNLFFVIALHMDVAGVALATIISQAISAVLVVFCLIKSEGDIHLDLRKLRINKEKLLELAKCGMPAGLQGILFSFSNVMIQSSINEYGKAVMAGNGAASNLEGFVYATMNTLYQACLAFTGQNHGARNYKRIRKTLGICLIYVFVIGLVLGSLVRLFGEDLLAIYRPDREPEVINAGLTRLSVVCATYFLCGIMDVLCGSLRGMGKTIMPMFVSLAGACGLRVIWILTIYKIMHTLAWLYASYPVSWAITALVHFICFLAVCRSMQKDGEFEPLSLSRKNAALFSHIKRL